MAVTFDAVGPSSAGQLATTTAAFTWTHTPSGTPTEAVVFLVAGLTGGGAAGALGSFASVSYGGNAMALDSSIAGNASTFGGIFCYKLANPPSGAQTVSVGAYTVPASSTFSQTLGFSVTTAGGGGFAAHPAAVSGNAATGSLSFLSTTSGGLCIAGACDGSGIESVTAGTQRFLKDQNSSSMGNAVGGTLASTGGTTTISFAWTLDFFGIVGVEVLPAGGAPPVPLPYVQQLPPGWFPGSDLVVTRPGTSPFYVPPAPAAVFVQPPPVLPVQPVLSQPPGWFPGADAASTQPGGIPFYVQPQPVGEPGAVLIPPGPPPPPTPLPPIGPYWFPGADVLASCPGDIPFWIQPQPDSSPPLPPSLGLPTITGLSGTTSAAWFQDQYGNPRWMFSDTVWTIVYSAGRSGAQSWQKDMDQVVSTRAAQGYTAMECNLLPNNEYIASGLTTWDGIHPFVTGTDPSSGLNDPYWQRVDYLLTSLASHGMTLFMNLIMGADVSAGTAGSWTSTQNTDYGNKVATRFLAVTNIVWMLGDDGGVGSSTLTNILAGIRNAGDTRFVSCENPQETTSRYGLKLNDVQTFGLTNAQYNWVYTYSPSYGGVEYAYGEASPIPVIRGDGYYYNSDGSPSDKISRESFWWCITSGSRGYSWGMSDGGWGAFASGWVNNLTMGADEIGTAGDFQNNVFPAVTNYLNNLAGWQKLAPDINNVFITAGRGTRAPYQTEGIQNQYTGTPADTYVSGSIAADGTLALIYFSRGAVTTISVNQSLLGTGYTATWVDPANVATTAGTPGPTFTKPAGANSAGDHDWLLVLQGPPPSPLPPPGPVLQLPPGWFPGSDQVVAVPGGIPFAQVSPPTGQNAAASTSTFTGTAAAAGAGAVAAVVTQIAPATAAGAGAVSAVVTQIAIGTAAGAGAVSAVATQIVTGTAAGAGADTALATQIAPATAAGAGAVSDVVTQDAGTLTTAAGAGAVSDVVTQAVIAAAAGAGAVSAAVGTPPPAAQGLPAGQPVPPGWFPGADTVTGLPGGIPFYVIPQATDQNAAIATATFTGTATAAGAGAVSDVVTQDAGTLTTAAGAGSVSDVVTQIATGTAAGAGSVTALATVIVPATAAGAAAVSDVVTQIVIGTAAGAGAATAVGTGSGAATGSAAGAAAVTALSTVIVPGTAAGQGTVTDVATQQAPGAAAGAGTVNAAGYIAGTASAAGAGAVTSKILQAVTGAGAGAGAVAALALQQATAVLAGAAVVNANGLSQAAVIKGTSTATTVTEQAGMSAAVTEQAGMSAAVTNPASSRPGVS